jgi:protein phosphatase
VACRHLRALTAILSGIIRAMTEPVVIEIPDRALVVLVGAAGAGKTTFAARHFAPDEVLSSDAYRAAISGDAGDQRATGPAFAALHRTVERRLGAGRLTVVDATNVTASARRAGRAAQAGVPAVAIVLDLGPGLVLARNRARAGRVVPEDVVRRQLADLAGIPAEGTEAHRKLEAEGFAAVVRLTDPSTVDAARIVRGARLVRVDAPAAGRPGT